ncbi:hypothetical protein G3T36_05065 [Diaminobutyricibacter tongyongensis]|uniref:Uncharacterized protein n=1 Tax=Leifsonia tongyongensis TaxID=1268043 RepID=A0A6L9XVJ0_9MICO|nr:hypothetical protein [Diaminobutyricibacter tongyongensis]NEN05237.1 hypothetical protein [Diaminobutyricibacter tongyongensis]
MSRLRPKVVLWWGIGLIAGGLVLDYAVQGIMFATTNGQGSNPLDQAMLGIWMDLLNAVNRTAPFIGAALIGASVVMFYLAKNLLPSARVPAATVPAATVPAAIVRDEASGERAGSAD